VTIFRNSCPSLSIGWEGFFFDGGMGLTPLGTLLTMTHHIYSDDFQELLPLSIHWMGGLLLWVEISHGFGYRLRQVNAYGKTYR